MFADDGHFMGAAPAPAQPSWQWRHGSLCLSYAPVRVIIQTGGWYKTGAICAVMPAARAYRPMWAVSLGEPHELRPGDDITITDGVIEITADQAALE